MSQARVVITDFVDDDLGPERAALEGVARIDALHAETEDELAGRVEDADALIAFHQLEISRRTIERLERCKLIVRCGVGFDNVDHRAARERGIPVGNVPDYGTEEVADSAIGLLLSLCRGISFLNTRLQKGPSEWLFTQVAPLHRLRGRVLGIVGLGRIGTATALRGKALGMDVAYYDPYKPRGYDKALGVRRAESLESLAREAFVLSLHCPLTDETRGMIGPELLALLPRGAYLVNTARGAVVDTAAVPPAIESGRLAGAGLDVLPQEPPDDADPLIRAWRDPAHPAHERVVINPHAAFYCEEGRVEMRTKAALACRSAVLGEPIPNVVN